MHSHQYLLFGYPGYADICAPQFQHTLQSMNNKHIFHQYSSFFDSLTPFVNFPLSHTAVVLLMYRSSVNYHIQMRRPVISNKQNNENHLSRLPQRYSAGLRAGWSGVTVSAGAGNFSVHRRVQKGSGAHPASYPMDTRGSFTGGKAAGAWSWPLTSVKCRGQECVEIYFHSPSTPSWCGA